MNYLDNYIKEETYEYINALSVELQSALSDNKEEVISILEYFKEIGVTNFDDIFKYRIDLLLGKLDILKSSISKLDSKLIAFIINNDVGNLINLGL